MSDGWTAIYHHRKSPQVVSKIYAHGDVSHYVAEVVRAEEEEEEIEEEEQTETQEAEYVEENMEDKPRS